MAASVEAGVAGADKVIGFVEVDSAAVDCQACINPFRRSQVLEVANTEGNLGDFGTGLLSC